MTMADTPAQAPKLLFNHLSRLEESGIGKDLAEAAGLFSASQERVKELVGFDAGPGIVFPYPGTDGFCRVRLDKEFQAPGWDKPAKYVTPKGAGNHLYFPMNLPEGALKTGILVLTEGEKKALVACARNIPCIGTAGVWAWKARNAYGEQQDDDDGLIEDFSKIDFRGRQIVLVYDSDITPEHVAWPAYPRLAEQIYAMGAHTVKIVTLPGVVDDGKTGLDDYLLKRTPEDFWKLVEDAPTWLPSGDGAEAFAETRLGHIYARLEAEKTPDAVYEQEALEALAALMMRSDLAYARAVGNLEDVLPPRKLPKKPLQKQVSKIRADAIKRQAWQHVQEIRDAESIDEFLPDAPISLRRPTGWMVHDKGVIQQTDEGPVKACSVPVLLTRRLQQLDTGEEKVEIAWRQDGRWKRISAKRSTVFHRSQIVTLADQGLTVNSESAKHLVRYLSDLEAANMDILPRQKTVSHFGWVGPQEFLPGAAGDVEFDDEQSGGSAVATAYAPRGKMEEWVEFARECRAQSSTTRLSLAAAFAAPLLRVAGQRSFVVYLFGDSRVGKSAAHALAASVWGEPESLKATFNTTNVGLERLATLYSDLPLWLDERQVLAGKRDAQGLVEGLVYMLGLGKGKTRGAKGGGLQATATWRTIALASGEQPLVEHNTPTGVSSRTLEFHCTGNLRPFQDEDQASRVYSVTAKHYGHAGPLFMEKLIDQLAKEPNAVAEIYEQFRETLAPSTGGLMGSHVSALALLLLADVYASQWIFGETDGVIDNAMALGDTLAGALESAAERDWSYRAMQWLRGWISQHAVRFEDNPGERWGWFDITSQGEVAYILPNVLEEHMRKAGFSVRRALSEWATAGLILTEEWSGKPRNRIRRAIPWAKGPYENRREPVIAVILKDPGDEP